MISLYYAAPTSPPVPLSITITPNSPNPYPLTIGDPLVLRCQATGGGSVTPTLSWLKDSKAVSQGVTRDSSGLLLSVPSVQVHKASEHNAPSMLCFLSHPPLPNWAIVVIWLNRPYSGADSVIKSPWKIWLGIWLLQFNYGVWGNQISNCWVFSQPPI